MSTASLYSSTTKSAYLPKAKTTPRDRSQHDVSRQARRACKACQKLILAFSGPLEQLDQAQVALWQAQCQYIPERFRDLYNLVIPAFVKSGLAPQSITTAALENLVEDLERFDRIANPKSKHGHQRLIRPLFSEAMRGLIIARQTNPTLVAWQALLPLLSSFEVLERLHAILPRSFDQELSIVRFVLTSSMKERTAAGYLHEIKTAAARLVKSGYPLATIRDLVSPSAIGELTRISGVLDLRAETQLKALVVLRWLATDHYEDVAARIEINKRIAQLGGDIEPQEVALDPMRYYEWAAEGKLEALIENLSRLARTGDERKEARSAIQVASGACLILLVIATHLEPSQLPRLIFGAQGNPSWSDDNPSESQKKRLSDKHVKVALEKPRVVEALKGFSELFQERYDKAPHSLASGANFDRDYETVMPSRMTAALKAAGTDLRPKDIIPILVTRLLIEGRDPYDVGRLVGYANPISFDRRFKTTIRFVKTMKLAGCG